MSQEEKGKGGGHIATYSYNRRSMQYMVRVVGPHADKFENREIPVSRQNGQSNVEKLTRLVRSGIDDGKVVPENKGKPWALYQFVQKPRGEEIADEIPF